MSVRELLNRHPPITFGIAAAVIVVAAVATLMASRSERADVSGTKPVSEYYTTDGGTTYFAAPADQIVPFVQNGKEAVLAHVIRCGNEAPRVQYLQRLSPETIKQIEIVTKERLPGWEGEIDRLKKEGCQFAEPGSKEWIGANSPKFAAFFGRMAKCPDGTEPVVVLPD
jgi:hypothetical protein